jgi:hypothetical protein
MIVKAEKTAMVAGVDRCRIVKCILGRRRREVGMDACCSQPCVEGRRLHGLWERAWVTNRGVGCHVFIFNPYLPSTLFIFVGKDT